MRKYISLLRGINVSGHKKIKMTDLKELYEKLGYGDVITYIQSGNVVFNSSSKLNQIKTDIEKAIEEKYSFTVDVVIRPAEDFATILKNMPFKNVAIEEDGSKILVTFLYGNPTVPNIDILKEKALPSEQIIFGDRLFYLHCPDGYGNTKLSNVFIEKKLKTSATTRNLKTVAKLCELSSD